MQIRTAKRNGVTPVHMEEFSSFGEFIRVAKDNPSPQSSNKEERPVNGHVWSKVESLDEACKLAHDGWNEIRPDVDKMLDSLTERLDNKFGEHYVTRNDVTGSFVDVGLYLQGEPECMVEWEPQPQASMGRVVRIAVSGTVAYTIDSDWIMRRGTAVLALVDVLHKMGVGIELWWDSTVENNSKAYTTCVKLHDSAEPLDIDSVMFALAHPAMLRRLAFSVQEQSPKAKEQHAYSGGGYGCPAEMGSVALRDYDVVVEKLQNGRGDIVVDPLGWVMSTVQGLGLAE